MKRIKTIFKNSILMFLSLALLVFLVLANKAGTITEAEEDGLTVTTETSDGTETTVSTSTLEEAGTSTSESTDGGSTSTITDESGTDSDTESSTEVIVSDSSGWVTSSTDSSDDSDINVTSSDDDTSSTSSSTSSSSSGSSTSSSSGTTTSSGSTSVSTKTKSVSYPDGTVAVITYTLDGTETTETYLTLAEAFADVAGIADTVHTAGDTSFVPVIQLQDDLTLTFNMTVSDSTSFAIDFNGHKIALDENILLDFGSSNVTFKDSTASTIYLDGITDNTKPGGIQGESGALVASTGILKFSTGYYRITEGCIAKNASEVIVNDAFLCAPGGMLVSNVSTLTINGGFFTYASQPCDSDCTLAVVNDGSLGDVTILLDGTSIDGHAVADAIFKVTVNQFGDGSSSNPTYSYATFEQAFTKAAELSSDGEGVEVVVELVDSSISAVSISKTYTLSKVVGGVAPLVELEGINITRGSVMDEALFDIEDGTLSLSDCTVNGQLSDSARSQGSMILVEDGATLKLTGMSTTGTKITGNTALVGMLTGDPCAGIWVKDGGKLDLSGSIVVNNNNAYTDSETTTVDGTSTTTEGTTASSNICLDSTARIVISGQILTTDTYKIGINHGDTTVVDGQVIGSLSSSFATEVDNDSTLLSLTAFFMDDSASFTLTYDSTDHTLYWDQTSGSLLPEAGVLRIEYLILLIGLIGFIFRNLPWIKGNAEALRYVTVLATICLVLGGAIGFYHLRSEQLLVENNQQMVEAITAETEKAAAEAPANETSAAEVSTEVAEETTAEDTVSVPDDGREYIGIIEIESLGIKLPVLSTYTDADMKTTPCVYYGSVESNNLVIVGHNYDSQFGDFNKLSASDTVEVKLTLVDGTTYVYQSKELEDLNPDQTDEMLQGQWDLTLFTCSYSGEKRITLRCDLVR